MIPVLGVPCISRPDLLERMLHSITVDVGETIIIDNGAGVVPLDLRPIRLPHNLGVAASWNLIIKLTPKAPWWLISNADVVYAQADLEALCEVMEDPSPAVWTMDGFAAFAINAACVEEVGFFDENYHPAYVEDCDYEYRCKLRHVPIRELPNSIHHDTSSTIADDFYAVQNARTYNSNVEYHRHKWGGHLRGGERFDIPNIDGDPAGDWQLDLRRLRENAWSTR